MIDHAHALDLAGAPPAFGLDAADSRDLRDHLGSCAACVGADARMRADLDVLGRVDPAVSARLHDRIREAAVTTPRSGANALVVVAVLVLLGIAVVGASIGVGAFLMARPLPADGPDVAARQGDAIHWRTDVVALAADEFWIDANGARFTGVPGVALNSDPGNLDEWTLEAVWNEHGREQRVNLYFNGDVRSWWIDEVRVYDGAIGPGKADWARFAGGPWVKTPRGASFSGNLDLVGTSATGPVTLHLGGLRIAVRPQDTITGPIGGRITLGENQDPFQPSGALYCSGILALTPAEAELRLLSLGYKLSWRFEYKTSTFPGGANGYSEVRAHAPDVGWISNTATGSSGELIVFVEDPNRPMGDPLPARPPGCPAPTSAP